MAVFEEDAESRRGSESQYGGRNFNYARTTSSWSDTDERKWTSWIIPIFAVANISVFIIVMLVNNCPKNHPKRYGSCVGTCLGRFSFEPLEENPLIGPSYSTLVKFGAVSQYTVVNQHERWRLFSSIWLHAGVVHLLVNIISLFFVGVYLEREFGFIKIGAIYLLSGFGGSILSTLFISNIFSVSVGASGALFGLLGAMLSDTLMNWTIYSNKIATILSVGVAVVINFVLGLLPIVDNFAHIGGFLTGFLLGFILLIQAHHGWEGEQRSQAPGNAAGFDKSRYLAYQYILWILSVILFIVWFATGLTMICRDKNGNQSCQWCHYLNCVPSSRWDCDYYE